MRIFVALLLACCLGLFASLGLREADYRRDVARLEEAARVAEQQTSIWQARFAESESQLVRDTVKLTRWLTRWDTVRALVEVPAETSHSAAPDWDTLLPVLVAADSTIAACRDLLSSCAEFRRVADSTIAASLSQTALYKNLYHASKPNWLERHWKGLSVGAFVGGVALGAWVRGNE